VVVDTVPSAPARCSARASSTTRGAGIVELVLDADGAPEEVDVVDAERQQGPGKMQQMLPGLSSGPGGPG
jgi:hypothetical protein